MPKIPKGKVQILVYVSEEVANKLHEYIRRKYPRSTHGALSSEVQKAIEHWLSEVGSATMEGDPNTHAHTDSGVSRVDAIIKWLRDKGYVNQFTVRDWEIACIYTVGSDKRTIDKYFKLAERLGRIKHVVGSVWRMM